jgi:hypothetical protein
VAMINRPIVIKISVVDVIRGGLMAFIILSAVFLISIAPLLLSFTTIAR